MSTSAFVSKILIKILAVYTHFRNSVQTSHVYHKSICHTTASQHRICKCVLSIHPDGLSSQI